MKYQKWHIGTAAEGDTALLREAGYPGLLATVLASRGITTAEAAAEALERETTLTLSPMLMRDMDKAVARIQRALANHETIAISPGALRTGTDCPGMPLPVCGSREPH